MPIGNLLYEYLPQENTKSAYILGKWVQLNMVISHVQIYCWYTETLLRIPEDSLF